MKKLFCSLVIIFTLTACELFNSDIIIEHGQKNQTVMADDTHGTDSILIKTFDAWTSIIREGDIKSSIVPDWISIDPSDGKEAGKYTIHITLKKNTTGEKRTAVITFLCKESVQNITITQEGTNNEGSIPNIPSYKESLKNLVPSYEKTFEYYIKTDNNYSSLESRKSLNPNTTFLNDIWVSAYTTIGYINTVLENIDNQSQIPDMEKTLLKGKCYQFRGNVYFFLTSLFGDIPVLLSTDIHYTNAPQTTAQEAIKQTSSDLLQAKELLSPCDSQVYYRAILVAMQQGDYMSSYNLAINNIENCNIMIRDTNNDGIIDDLDENVFAIQSILLAAESALQTGISLEAIMHVNSLYRACNQPEPLALGSTKEAIMTTIQNAFRNKNDRSIKLMNAIRWGDTNSWGKFALLPIPQSAMAENPLLSQNTGW